MFPVAVEITEKMKKKVNKKKKKIKIKRDDKKKYI
jgi:hypothetical protein